MFVELHFHDPFHQSFEIYVLFLRLHFVFIFIIIFSILTQMALLKNLFWIFQHAFTLISKLSFLFFRDFSWKLLMLVHLKIGPNFIFQFLIIFGFLDFDGSYLILRPNQSILPLVHPLTSAACTYFAQNHHFQ